MGACPCQDENVGDPPAKAMRAGFLALRTLHAEPEHIAQK
jgi:hypothetical protein